MKQDWIAPYEQKVGTGKYIRLSSSTSTSRSLKVALNFAFGKQDPEFTPVLFVFFMFNYGGVNGLMMNNSAFTAYPSEGELLLMEGFEFTV